MLSQFRTYQLAVQFHHACRAVKMPGYLKNQLLRECQAALELAPTRLPSLIAQADHLGASASLYKLCRINSKVL